MEQKMKAGNYSISDLLLLVVAFTLPFYQQASIIAIILLVLVWVVQKKYASIIPTLKRHPQLLLLIIYFLLHLAGLLWSANMKYGWSDIETKLSFLIMPVVLGTTLISNNILDQIKRAFIAGNIIACIYCLITATISYWPTGDQSVFFYTALSKLMHTTYFTFYLNLALIFILEAAIKKWNNCSAILKWAASAIIILFILTIILLSARMAIAVSLVTILFYCVTQIIKYKKGTFILILSVLVIAVINYQITQLFNRYTQVEETVQNYQEPQSQIDTTHVNAEGYNSTTTRIELWKDATQVIKRNWFLGVGTGDIKEELVKEYASKNFQYGVVNKYNPHNQYLHTGVVLGFTGIIILLCCLLLPLRLAFQQQNWIYICFLMLIIINAITESILEVQKGILFFSFFNVLFYIQSVSYSKK